MLNFVATGTGGKYVRAGWSNGLRAGGERANVPRILRGTRPDFRQRVELTMDVIFILLIVVLFGATAWLTRAIADLRGGE